jgi:hypothetical protein
VIFILKDDLPFAQKERKHLGYSEIIFGFWIVFSGV